jgi:hypothetical protein
VWWWSYYPLPLTIAATKGHHINFFLCCPHCSKKKRSRQHAAELIGPRICFAAAAGGEE